MPTSSCPFACAAHPNRADYGPGSLPVTDDLLARTVAVSVGVRDSYLGTSFGIGITAKTDELLATAATLRSAVERAHSDA